MIKFRVWLLCGLWLTLACGCGSGGGGGFPGVALGLVSGTRPTHVAQTLTNPFASAATVTVVPAPGPFAFDSAPLPLGVPGAAAFDLDVIFTPTGPGFVQGEAVLLFDDGMQTQEVSVLFGATAETVTWWATPPNLCFAGVQAGQAAQADLLLRNSSTLSPVTFLAGQVDSPVFTLLAPVFPFTLGPGEEQALTLRYAPDQARFDPALLELVAQDPAPDLHLHVLGYTPQAQGEWIVEFGTTPLTQGLSSELRVDLPAEAISVAIEIKSSGNELYDVAEWLPPSGPPYRSLASNGPLQIFEKREIRCVHVPNSDNPALQLPPGGGLHRLRIGRAGTASSGSAEVRAHIEIRPQGLPGPSLLDLNIWLLPDLGLTAAQAPSDPTLQIALARMNEVLAPLGIALGEIEWIDSPSEWKSRLMTNEDLYTLCRGTGLATHERVNVFLALQVLTGQTIGLSSSIDGTRRNGLSGSGLAVRFDGFLTPNVLGLILAHETCHYLGLFHTRELKSPIRDPLADTAPCATGLPPGTCDPAQPPNLMHYVVDGASHLTPNQGRVLLGHPHIRPGTVQVTSLKPGPASLQQWLRPLGPEDLRQLEQLGTGACGCCAAAEPAAEAAPGPDGPSQDR